MRRDGNFLFGIIHGEADSAAFHAVVLRDLLHSRPAPGNWPQYIASSVDRHKVGRAEDDVLVASLTFAAVRPQRLIAKPAMSRP